MIFRNYSQRRPPHRTVEHFRHQTRHRHVMTGDDDFLAFRYAVEQLSETSFASNAVTFADRNENRGVVMTDGG